MFNFPKTSPLPCPDIKIWSCVFHSLENERSLDIHYRNQSTTLGHDPKIPNYKIMKQLALRERFGTLYRPALILAQLLIPILGIAQLGVALGISLLKPIRKKSSRIHVIATTPNNVRLIESALSQDVDWLQCDFDLLRLSRLATEIRLKGVLHCALSYFQLMIHVLCNIEKRRDMILHTRDSVTLIMLTYYAKTNPSHNFVTDDHYQRWSYLLSHNNQNLHIVQHGFIDNNINFKHSFGLVHKLFVRNSSFVECFAKYYNVLEWTLFTPYIKLENHPYAVNGLFLASSFPSIDAEIQFVKLLRQRSDVPLIIKFHPSHHYDERKQVLCSFANYICPSNQYPACKIFVSNSSFMEYDYRALGIPTVSIINSNNVENAVKTTLQFINN